MVDKGMVNEVRTVQSYKFRLLQRY
ncbi:hypothetical protein RDI58_016943 [Solanum bulbocastanum]|uniref:Uncharacterized protein n=1 Tax=Solanum bulbocastanum TaxID=147425 RepID=A0AAN8TH63_SOLBU